MFEKKQLILASCIAASFLAVSTAQASDWYVSAQGGYASPTSTMFNDGANGAGNPKFDLQSDASIGIAVGREIAPGFKVEASYTTFSTNTDTGLQSGTDGRAADQFGLNASADSKVLLLNAAYEFNTASPFKPYIKAGIGANFFDVKGDLFVSSSGGNTFGGALPAVFSYSGDDRATAYFIGLGITGELSSAVDFTAEIRHSDFGQVATEFDANGDRLQSDLKTNALILGVEYSF